MLGKLCYIYMYFSPNGCGIFFVVAIVDFGFSIFHFSMFAKAKLCISFILPFVSPHY